MKHVMYYPSMRAGWFPGYWGFCPSERAWKIEMKRLGKDWANEAYPDHKSDALTTRLTESGKLRVIIVTIAASADKKPNWQIMELLVHEAVHVFDRLCEDAGEDKPSIELHAYGIQNITDHLWTSYHKSRKKLWR